VLLGYGIAQSMLGRPLRIRISNVVRDSRHQTLEKQGYRLAAIQCHEWKGKPTKELRSLFGGDWFRILFDSVIGY
jgi:hypothetical protein